MKATIAYYFLLLYASALFRPAFPLVSDAMSHTFCEAVHISSVHMVYGSQHMQKEVAAENADSKKSSSNIEKNAEFFAVHLTQSVCEYSFPSFSSCQIFYSFDVAKLPFWSMRQLVPPPDFLG